MKISNKYPIVALVGRTNVGKSTLFNRLTERNQAIVSNIENTTRDSNISEVDWSGKKITLIDTAGIIDIKHLTNKKLLNDRASSIDLKTQKQIVSFFKKASLIIFLVDNKAGLLPADKEIVKFFQKRPELTVKTILAVNKVDSHKQKSEAAEFNKLGISEISYISAATGAGTGDLLDVVFGKIFKTDKVEKKEKKDPFQHFEEEDIDIKKENVEKEAKENKINVCIIGKPNVGKSSLLNSILGYERVIVSDIPHTTREPQNMEITYNDRVINLIDTAGISRHGHKAERLEKYGIMKSLATLKRADIALLVLDISQEITHQDSKIIEEIMGFHKSFIILGNKWDLVENRDTKKWTEQIYRCLPFATWAPLQFISASTGSKVNKIFDLILKIAEARKTELSDSQLDKFLNRIVKIHKPAKGKGIKHPRIYHIHQVGSRPPRFEVRIGSQDDLHFSYVRFIQNQLREQFKIVGTPISVKVVKNRKIHGASEEKSANN